MSLYLVATPLGNLEDLSARARRVLAEARAVYCEDTRRTRGLLSHLGLSTPLARYDDRDARGVERLLERLERGEDVALVSDAGTPVLSDPG
ncbi:MAG: 16S rRNA (cytidine(1402)-2'-O)-methyltransferase, partial [Elusimicrobia bacterium]|nr:16S rRNA (cytidine(1402)-2'-O)-methyltransferase [Elusimicrobiota bacterium]